MSLQLFTARRISTTDSRYAPKKVEENMTDLDPACAVADRATISSDRFLLKLRVNAALCV